MTATAAEWSTVFRRSTVHPAVFAVRDRAAAAELLAWATARDLPHRHQAYAFSAALDGWALLDGGLSYLQSRARGRLRSGLRVVGWSALRYLAAELDLVPPRRLLVGEPARNDEVELDRLVDEGWFAVTPPARQAAMLVSYVDARGLQEVACALAAPPAGSALVTAGGRGVPAGPPLWGQAPRTS